MFTGTSSLKPPQTIWFSSKSSHNSRNGRLNDLHVRRGEGRAANRSAWMGAPPQHQVHEAPTGLHPKKAKTQDPRQSPLKTVCLAGWCCMVFSWLHSIGLNLGTALVRHPRQEVGCSPATLLHYRSGHARRSCNPSSARSTASLLQMWRARSAPLRPPGLGPTTSWAPQAMVMAIWAGVP